MSRTAATPDPVYILGAGMHPWGKWGRDFTEYGVAAARTALQDAALDWRQIQFVAGADTIRNGYPGFIAGSTFAQKLGWNGVPISSTYAACASGSQALQSARAQILAGFCDVALVIGADTTPKGFFAPVGGERKEDPDWQRFHLIGATNPVYFAMLARRRMDLYGATAEDFAQVKVKNARHGLNNPNARFRKEASVADVLASPVVSDPLRLLDICATSDGAAALIVASAEFAKKHLGSVEGVPSVRAVATITPKYPQHLPELPDIATDSTAVVPAPERVFKDQIVDAAYAEAGIGPEDLSLAEVYDLSTALELDWYEHLGLCAKGEGEQLLRSGATTVGGRVPVNASGGLASFGEAIPAQAIAQVCELTWQLRGQAGDRQVEGARVGITANQGLFGNGSSVIVAR
ncbi:lipid-transfer protein [Mycobacterium sp. NPDC050853]|uniref:lipid-transfer protein n=1 Tax=Mycobacteriaceae TaxID=1762 RepID=UPI0015DE344D|nr:lipid-transfer protein [Mycobacteroides sp. LB1]